MVTSRNTRGMCALKCAHCHVLMPLSPLGGDGLCSEAKIGLEVLELSLIHI